MPPKNNFHGYPNLAEPDVCVALNLVEIGVFIRYNLAETDILSTFVLCYN